MEGGSVIANMSKKNNKRPNGLNCCFRGIGTNNRGSNSFRDCIKINYKSFKNFTRNLGREYNKGFKRLLNSTEGFISTVEFLLWLIVIMFVLFGGIDYYITEVQHNMVEETTNFYLSKMKFAGTLYDSDKWDLINELDEKGFKNINVSATDGYGNELSSDTIIVRDTEDLTASVLFLEVKAEPHTKPFMFGRLLGAKEEDDFYFKVDRRSISERPAY